MSENDSSSSDYDSSDENESLDRNDTLPKNILEEAALANAELIPPLSKEKYQAVYNSFMTWRESNKVQSFDEQVFQAYFQELSRKYSPTTLWSKYSMLKATLYVYQNVDIPKYTKLVPFLKRKNEGYTTKKSEIFTSQELMRFFNTAPDDQWLVIKTVAIIGIKGACRGMEIMNLTINDVETYDNLLLVNLTRTKTKKDRSFTIRNDSNGIKYFDIVQKYRNLRPKNCPSNRFFLGSRKGQCIRQPLGKNIIGKMPMKIAEYLNLNNPKLYTGHCFRRTAATLAAEAGAHLVDIKRLAGHKSDTVAQTYIDNSMALKERIDGFVTSTLNDSRNSPERPSSSSGSYNNQPERQSSSRSNNNRSNSAEE